MRKMIFTIAALSVLMFTSPLIADIVLQDDFNSGTLDTTKWTAVDTPGLINILPEGFIEVGDSGVDRCYLVTSDEWNTTQGTLTITGKFLIADPTYVNSSFEVWLRATDSYDSQQAPNGTGTLSDGVLNTLWEGSLKYGIAHLTTVTKEDTVWPTTAVGDGVNFPADSTGEPATEFGQIDWSLHSMYDFTVVDNGTNVTFTITDQYNTLFTATSSEDTTFASGSYHVAFGGVGVALDEVTFDYVGGVIEIPGDANNDQKVDGSDVTILANNWQKGVNDGLTAIWSEGDFNHDGKVDGSDVTILANNWQYGVTTAAASVPEPSTVILLLSMITGIFLLRRKS